jgi:hypothetical protein
MKLGVAINLGTILTPVLLERAAELRGWDVGHVCYAAYPVDKIDVATGNDAKLQADTAKVVAQLTALTAMGVSVGVRPLPMILEQIVEKTLVQPPGGGEATAMTKVPTPNFTTNNTSIIAAKLLVPHLGKDDGIAFAHEIADFGGLLVRSNVINQLGTSAATCYWGFHGLVDKDGGPGYKFGADFGRFDAPHTIYVALNSAGAGDASAPGASPGPAECTPKDIRHAAEMFGMRIRETLQPPVAATAMSPEWKVHFHINFLADASVSHITAMLAAARIGFPYWNVGMVRLVHGKNDPLGPEGNTLKDAAGKHVVTPNALQAIKECAAWMA